MVCPRSEYPPDSVRANEQGPVKIRFHVDERGRVERTELLGSSGFERLDAATVEMLSRCVFKPVVKDGAPQTSHVVEYVWRLQ